MMKQVSFVSMLLFLVQAFSAGANGTTEARRVLEGADCFESDFELIFDAQAPTTDDVEQTSALLSLAFNNLVQFYENEYDIMMGDVTLDIAEVITPSSYYEGSRRLLTQRKLPQIRARVTASGSCSKCGSGTKFTHQVSGRRNLKKQTHQKRKLKSSKSSGDGSDGPPAPTLKYSGLIPGLPTEEDLRIAFSALIQNRDTGNVVDVGDLSELGDESPTGTTAGETFVESECLNLHFEYRTDCHPEDNLFSLLDENGNFLWDERQAYPKELYEYTNECLDASKCYTIDLYDFYGDGLTGEGYLRVSIDNEVVYYGTSDIGSGILLDFGNGCDY